MANPQPDKYTKVSNELLENIPKYKFNGSQLRILLVLIRYTYGFKRKQAELSLTFLSKATQIHKEQLRRELDKLIENKVITVVKKSSYNSTRIISFNKDYDEWNIEMSELITRLSTNNQTVSELPDTFQANNQTEPVSELPDQETKGLKKTIKKEIWEIFNHYLSLGLVQHKILTPSMEKSIKRAMTDNCYTIEDCIRLLDRHKLKVESTKNTSYPVRVRTLDVFFGQKVANAQHLICSEYEDGGKYAIVTPMRQAQRIVDM